MSTISPVENHTTEAAVLTKRDATPEETEKMIRVYERLFPDTDYRLKEAECVADGLKSETCSCGHTLPACIHWVRCDRAGCPMKGEDSKTLLDMIYPDSEEESTK